MTVVQFPRHQRTRLPATPAFGRTEPVGWRRAVARLAPLVALLAVALLVRASGVLRPATDSSLPPLPGAAVVAPGLVRGSPPQDLDLVRLRDDYRVRGVVGVDGVGIEERAAAGSLGLRTLDLHGSGTAAPSADDVLAVVRFLHETGLPAHTVYLHDTTGHGPVVVLAAVLRLLRGVPLATVQRDLSHDELGGLSVEQLVALREVDAVVHGQPAPSPRYAALRGVTW